VHVDRHALIVVLVLGCGGLTYSPCWPVARRGRCAMAFHHVTGKLHSIHHSTCSTRAKCGNPNQQPTSGASAVLADCTAVHCNAFKFACTMFVHCRYTANTRQWVRDSGECHQRQQQQQQPAGQAIRLHSPVLLGIKVVNLLMCAFAWTSTTCGNDYRHPSTHGHMLLSPGTCALPPHGMAQGAAVLLSIVRLTDALAAPKFAYQRFCNTYMCVEVSETY
jgi:hypothetical protein